MPKNDGRISPQLGAKGVLHDGLKSICSLCRRGIFAAHAFQWSNVGLVHTECLDAESSDEIEVITGALPE